MKKAISMIAIIFVLVFSCTGCKNLFDDTVPRDEIFSYVNSNYEYLEYLPYDDIPKEWQAEKDFIQEHLGNDTIVKGMHAYNENIFEFYCGGSGLVTGSTYVGFYLSKDDTPFAMDFDGCELIEVEPDIFEWQNEDGTHKIRTEKIRDNWYYYIEDYY